MVKSVMIIDDNETDLWLAENILKLNAFCSNTISSKNGNDALLSLEKLFNEYGILPEVILVDLHLPLFNGFEIIDAIQSLEFYKPEKTFLVALSADFDENDNATLSKLGIIYRLFKPLNLQDLAKICNRSKLIVERDIVA